MTATVVNYTAGDAVAAKAALETLAPGSTDKVVQWQHNNMVYVAKVTV